MDWWSRLVGGTPKKTPAKTTANDPQLRYAKFKRNYDTVVSLCNRPRNLATEAPLLGQLHGCIERVAVLIREETRAPAPHYALQFAAANKIYTVITRAAIASQHEPIIRSTVSFLGALIDSEEEDFLSNVVFAKCMMRMVTKVIDSGTILAGIETETAILELLFTIAAKIRLQPDILSNWFHSTTKPELEDVFVKEKRSFAGITAKEDFPLCYFLVDRVHHEGRAGDFARTGLLYIFEATGRSTELEEWVVSSDLPTLMASGLGALYSQLSRELSILHPDATLPAVLAMSDYTTTQLRATAESAFSENHKRPMSTFLSYLAFWQDILDHCKSADVKQTLLDHFQILFLQQLLYPSLLQSSDTDAGSSVAVLTYLTAMLESLEYPDLINMMLEYLLAIQDNSISLSHVVGDRVEPPRSPTAVRRRQSLMLLAAPKDPDDAVEPALFSLVDSILNNISSRNSQSVFASLKLVSTILTRQKRFALGTLLRVQKPENNGIERTVGALELEMEKFGELATLVHERIVLQDAFAGLEEDVRAAIETQVPLELFKSGDQDNDGRMFIGCYIISQGDHLLKALRILLRTFFTNSVDVNLALSQAFMSVALCMEIRLDNWLAIDPSKYNFTIAPFKAPRPWQSQLDDDEEDAFARLQRASRLPEWSEDCAPLLYRTLRHLAEEIETVRSKVPNLDHLISVRKTMLQATSLDTPLLTSNAPSLASSPTRKSFLEVPTSSAGIKSPGNSRSSSLTRGRKEAHNVSSPQSRSLAASPVPNRMNEKLDSPAQPTLSVFLPPPPEVPSTTDVLMQQITLPFVQVESGDEVKGGQRTASLNHILTNVVILQEFVLELIAVMQVRAAVFEEREVRFS